MIASDLMTRHVYATTPQASIREASHLLYDKHISGLPVVDEESGRVLGMLTEADILTHCMCDGMQVAVVMSRQPIIVNEETPINEVAIRMAEQHVKSIPVVHAGYLVGIISRADIVEAVAMGELVVRPW